MTRWFPIAPGTTLPAAPAAVGGQITATKTIPVWNETVLANGISKTKLAVTGFTYALNLLSEITVASSTVLDAARSMPAASIALAGAAPNVRTGGSVKVAVTAQTLEALIPDVVSGASVTVPIKSVTFTVPDILNVGTLRTIVSIPSVNTILASATPVIVGGGSVITPSAFIALAIHTPTISSTSSFNPLTLSPTAWWDASDSGSVTTVSGKISALNDKSGNGYHLLQANASARPIYQANAVNGRSAVSIPADAASYLATSDSSITLPREVYIVALYGPIGAFSPFIGGLFSANTDAGATGPWVAGLSTYFYNSRYDSGYFLNGGSTDRQSNVFPELNSACLIRAVSSQALTFTAGYQIGCDRNYYDAGTFGYRYWNGYICEIMAFATPLSSSDRTQLQGYLASKWGISLV